MIQAVPSMLFRGSEVVVVLNYILKSPTVNDDFSDWTAAS